MYISKMKLHNFKSFEGDHELNFKSGINFFVGDNNSGKTTIFKAIEFIQGGKIKSDWITKGKKDEEVSVEILFSGNDIEQLVEQDSLKKYADFVFEENGIKNLRILRDSKKHVWISKNGNKNTPKTTKQKNVLVWHPTEKEWQNPTGIDSTISALFDAQFVYSDLKNEEYQDFGKAKIVGKLINAVTADFQQSSVYKELRVAHETAFGDQGLTAILKDTQDKIEEIISEQYGKTGVKFNFGLPELDNFFKTGQILLSDNGIETDASEKGTGMQRVLALALIQLYADVIKSDATNDKPIFFFIDEPETFLHPKAQDKLINSLKKISNFSQIFITTHSPYLLKHFEESVNQINVFSRERDRISNNKDLNLFPSFSPTWGEINYVAFDVVSIEFHNELYGYLENHFKKNREDVDFITWKNSQQPTPKVNFETWLNYKGFSNDVDYFDDRKENGDTPKKSLPTFVRHIIHHPENNKNYYTLQQLSDSISKMIELVKKI
ncbi:ATP-binding protein [Pseudolactococcus yaeyamensis]